VPADHRLRLENFQCVQYSRSYTIEPRKHKAVKFAEGQSLRGFAPQDIELVSKNQDLSFQGCPWSEQSDQGAPEQPAKIAHRERVPIRGRGQPFWVCGRHRGWHIREVGERLAKNNERRQLFSAASNASMLLPARLVAIGTQE
jgi:hypothetical protein